MIKNKQICFQKDLADAAPFVSGKEKLKGKTVLVTGAGGLIGQAVVHMLIHLNEAEDLQMKVYAGMRDERAFEECFKKGTAVYFEYDMMKPLPADVHFDFIVHCAGMANPSLYVNRPVEVMTTAFVSAQNILTYAKEAGTESVVVTSSSEIYGRVLKDKPVPICEDEQGSIDLLNVRSSYGISKRAVETLCKSYAQEYDVPVSIVRPGHIYGPTAKKEDMRISSVCMVKAQEGENIVLKSSGRQIRSYCHAADCASAILTVLLTDVRGDAYNISNKDSICTIAQMAEAFAKAGGIEVVYEVAKSNEKQAFNPMDNAALDAKKLESLGWRGAISMETGAKHSIGIL